ncbi:acrB/AcrD/AcrF family domain protein, partial [Vibrio parahaemolyticus 10296]
NEHRWVCFIVVFIAIPSIGCCLTFTVVNTRDIFQINGFAIEHRDNKIANLFGVGQKPSRLQCVILPVYANVLALGFAITELNGLFEIIDGYFEVCHRNRIKLYLDFSRLTANHFHLVGGIQ